MLIKKGPFGYFAVERFDSPECIFSYAGEVIDVNRSGCLLPCSIDVNGISSSAYFDFSGLISVRQSGSALLQGSHRSKKLSKLLNDRRRSAGDFFCSVPPLLDNLISPSVLVLDPDYVFTDEEGSYIKFCLIPYRSSPDLIRLSSLGAERLESFLSEPFFDGVLTNDEKQELIYSVNTDDESLFIRCARQIRDSNTDTLIRDDLPEIRKSNAPKHLTGRTTKSRNISSGGRKAAKIPTELLWSLAGSIAAAVSLVLSGILPALLFFLVSGVILIKFLINHGMKKNKKGNRENLLSRERSMILFSDGDEPGKFRTESDTNARDADSSPPVLPLSTGTLTSVPANGGTPRSYSVMMDRTTIGSDVFLSDIVIDDPSVDPLHAIIYLNGRSFYISDCSRKGTTYIDDRKAACGRKCEIKNGQKITVGTVDFRFKVLFPSAGQAWTSEPQIHNAQ